MSLRKEKEEQHPCFRRREGVPALQVTLANGEAYLFPYIHLQSAHLTHDDSGNHLQIDFSSHQISITGTRLKDILTALQMLSVEWMGEHFQTQSTSRCKIHSLKVSQQNSESMSRPQPD